MANSVKTKEYFKLSVIYTLVAAFPSVLQLIVQPFIQGKGRLGATDFGQMGVAEIVITLLFILCIFSMDNSISRYYYDVRDDKHKFNQLVSTIFTGILLRSAILLAFIFFISPFVGVIFHQDALRNFESWGIAVTISAINRAIVTTAVSLYRNEKKINSFILVNMSSGIFRALFQVLGVFFFSMSFLGYVYGTAVGSSIISLAVIIYVYRRSGFHFVKSINRELFHFGWPLLEYSIVGWGLMFLDRIFLERGDPKVLGVYTNAMTYAVGVQLIIQGLVSATQPELFRYMSDGINERVEEIKKISNMFIIQSLVIIIGTILPTILFLQIFYGAELSVSASIISIVFVRYILRSQYQIFAMPIMFMKRTRIFSIVNYISLAVSLLFNWLLIPKYGYYGAITAFIVANSVQVVIVYYFQQKIIPIPWNLKKVMGFPFIVLLTSVLCEIGKYYLGLSVILGAIIITVVTFVGIVFLYKNEVHQLLQKRLKFLNNV
ncbi:MAG: oligosaccharide flippase family protein [Bacteroidetes bacterium]|nr:oligosaccharide flippase family protein [Bacteroidota bacterium]